ncbi:hypothetical protein L6164_026800 [Bauhinia variegata]|uniref:Uncharacterized protein n=1 Tax=Bauhinia variegata TaxID=167791 RepID=A0ACB9LS59_BAUVA|nr:hypothetical protein L6164_026800 [Bauhinia variegata]
MESLTSSISSNNSNDDSISCTNTHIQYSVSNGLDPRGLLLYGPPDTGKTSLVRAVVQECGAHLNIISPHSVHRAHAGESERILREAFAEASSHAALGKPSVIFIDEIDALCRRRGSKKEQDVQVASQLFTLMDSNKPSSSMPGVVDK